MSAENIEKALEIAMEIEKQFEGWSDRVYLCPAGYPTIGWGHRCWPDHPPIDRAQGEEYLRLDNQEAISGVLRHCPGLIAHPEKMGAVIDFTFNLGVGNLQASTLRRRINQGNWAEARYEIRRWVRAGGRKLAGLVARREVEAAFL